MSAREPSECASCLSRRAQLSAIAAKLDTLRRKCTFGCATHGRQKLGDTFIVYPCSCGAVLYNKVVDAIVELTKGDA